jgi:hypothetical protein
VVLLGVPRIGGRRARGAVSGDSGRRVAGQGSRAVTSARIGSRSRLGEEYVGVTISMTLAVTAAWHVFRKAAGDDITGWDTAVATAEIRSLTALAHQAVASSAQSVDARRPHGGAWRPGGATGRAG